MKAAAYIRAGASADRDRQLEPIRRRAEVSGWELVDIYADPSGRRGNRPSFQRLPAAAEQRTVDVIIIERLDCLVGSLRELAHLFEDLRRCQVSLVSLDEEIDTSTGHGDLMCHVMRAVGRFERRPRDPEEPGGAAPRPAGRALPPDRQTAPESLRDGRGGRLRLGAGPGPKPGSEAGRRSRSGCPRS